MPLFENPELAELLAQLDLGDEIPDLLYRCIAQVIAFAYFIRGRFPEGWQPPSDDAWPEETTGNEIVPIPGDGPIDD